MIRASKKILLSLIVLTSVFMMSLYFGGSHATVLKAEGAQKYYRSERMGIPAVSINGSLASSFIANGYYDVTRVPGHYSDWHTMSINLPNLNNEITNFNIATIDEAYFKINIKYTGTDNNVSGYRFQYFDKLYNATNMGGNFYEVEIPYDARNMVQAQLINFTPLNVANGNGGYIPTNGATRINGVTVSVDYHYDVDDPISPIVDGAGALVESVNLAKPDLAGKVVLENGNYRIYESIGFTIDYDKKSSKYVINGQLDSSKTINLRKYNFIQNQTYILKYYYESGSVTLDSSSILTILARNDNNDNPKIDSGININNYTNSKNVSSINSNSWSNIDIYVYGNVLFTNYTFKIQIEEGDTASTWMHPDAKYYSMASIQHDQNLDSTDTIMSNVYAFDDVDGNISDRLTVVRTPRDYAAALANAWGIKVNDALAAYDDQTLSIPITSEITFDNTYVDSQFLIYQETTFWYKYDNDLIEALGTSQSYPFMVYVGDNAGNYTFLEVNVFVNDATAPVFDETNNFVITVSYKSEFDLDTWISNIIINDNVDTYIDRVIYTNGYTANKSIPGNYIITVRATDDTGNIKDQAFTFNVVDDIKPTFNGPESIFKPQSSQMTINNIIGRYTAFDEISGNVTSRITILEDNYTGRGHIANVYTVILKVTDIVGNYETFTIYITVSDDIPPVIYIADGYFIQVSAAYTLTIQGIKDILVATGRLTIVSATTWSVLVNEYQGNENNPGIYTISIRFSQTSGVSEVHSVAVNVKNASTEPGGVFQPENNNTMMIVAGLVIVVGVYFVFRKKR